MQRISMKQSLSDSHKYLCGAQSGGQTSIVVLDFFCSVEAMPMYMIFQGRGAYQEKQGSEHRILCAVWVRQGGRVETINQLKDVTLTVWRSGGWTRLRWLEWRGTDWEQTLMRASFFPARCCLQLVLSGSSDWLAPSSILSLDCIQLYTSFSLKLIKSLLPSSCFSSLALLSQVRVVINPPMQ